LLYCTATPKSHLKAGLAGFLLPFDALNIKLCAAGESILVVHG
jgi:hypothetical protein